MRALPENFHRTLTEVLEIIKKVDGHLARRECKFLFLLGACPTAPGAVLEIGSFKGKSTIVLAKAVQLAGDAKVVAVDPLTAPSPTDPDLKGSVSTWDQFQTNRHYPE